MQEMETSKTSNRSNDNRINVRESEMKWSEVTFTYSATIRLVWFLVWLRQNEPNFCRFFVAFVKTYIKWNRLNSSQQLYQLFTLSWFVVELELEWHGKKFRFEKESEIRLTRDRIFSLSHGRHSKTKSISFTCEIVHDCCLTFNQSSRDHWEEKKNCLISFA